MAVQRELWNETFSADEFPSFICPRCEQGRMGLDKKTLKVFEPDFSKDVHSHDAWEPTWIEERFVAVLHCSSKKCGEIVTVCGDTIVEEVAGEDDWSYEQQLRPRGMFPAPPIISIPEKTPPNVQQEIGLAFQLFWSDLGASANRLRTSVEFLLDDFKIPRAGKNAKGKISTLSLQNRIKAFKEVDADHVTTFDALRIVGNLGTHEDDLKREVLLDAFDIYEDALSDLFAGHKKRIDALRKKIIEKKGKY